ncbi:hypothetical protein ATANTOWER_026887 [Ataeniobius toweri]|uniref:Uncharacterized protein n=1 Tax=Ataeniobius toweri TaxID=208326 RepID=A0ABU7C1K1_9TELE|nr:hypothetical protein [Ataeniobius toweri]
MVQNTAAGLGLQSAYKSTLHPLCSVSSTGYLYQMKSLMLAYKVLHGTSPTPSTTLPSVPALYFYTLTSDGTGPVDFLLSSLLLPWIINCIVIFSLWIKAFAKCRNLNKSSDKCYQTNITQK